MYGYDYDQNRLATMTTASTPSLRATEADFYRTYGTLPNAPGNGGSTLLSAGNEQESANVKVVVRVRQFVQREIDRDAPCIIRMDPESQSTTLFAPVDPSSGTKSARRDNKTFTFDKSFWSHSPRDSHYATQQDIYSSFGEEFLDHNFNGFHTCIFAYGQTGSGKSYTMMGTPEQPGLTPRTCEALFARIRENPEPNTTYSVHVSYFEVYNEHVRDLLAPKSSDSFYLKIRESQTEGVYIQGLTDAAVKDYADVQRLMKLGDANRTTASTKMNDTSSRSHAVFTIQLKQIQHSLTTDETIERTARMRLVDLAGSERANKTEATGQRLVEGGKINKSLTTLGRVIAALADPKRPTTPGRNSPRAATPTARPSKGGSYHNHHHHRSASHHPEVVPYRDSVLTWLLKDSLGGNSKTAMVACISPVDYDETLSTLRYADQAKRIRTRATANIDAVSAAERDAQISLMAATIRALQVSVNNAHVRKREEATELEDYQKQVDKMQRLMEETRQVSDARIRALTAEVEDMRPENERLRREVEALRRHLGLVVGELKNPIVIPQELRTLDAEADLYSLPTGVLEEEEEGEEEQEENDRARAAAVASGDDDSAVDITDFAELAEQSEQLKNIKKRGIKKTATVEDATDHDGDAAATQAPPMSPPSLFEYTDELQNAWALELQEQADQMLREIDFFKQKVNSDCERFPLQRPMSPLHL